MCKAWISALRARSAKEFSQIEYKIPMINAYLTHHMFDLLLVIYKTL